MTDVVAQYVATVGADVTGLMAGLQKMKSGFSDFSQDVARVGQTLTATITGPLVGFAALAVKSFSDSEMAAAQLNAVLKSTNGIAGVTAKQATDLAASLQKVTRFSDETILGAENIALTFSGIGKEIFPDVTKAALDMATAMHMDVNAAMLSIGKAINEPIDGLTKLERQGVVFTAQQKEMVKSLSVSGNKLAAQKIILAELKKEFGGSAEAAGNTFAGAIDKLKNKFDDLLEVIGSKIAPVLSKGIDFLSGLIDKISALPEPVVQAGVAFGALLAAVGPILTIAGALGTVIAALASPIGLVVAGVGALAAAFATNFGGIRDAVMPIITQVKDAISSLFSDTMTYTVKRGDNLTKIAKEFGTTWQELAKDNNLKDPNKLSVGMQLQVPTKSPIQGLIDNLKGIWGQVSPELGKLKDWFLTDALPKIRDGLTTFIDKGVKPVISILKDVWIVVEPYLTKLKDWFLSSALPSIATAVGDFISQQVQPLIDVLKLIWDAVSPKLEAFASWFHDNLPVIKMLFDQTIGAITTQVTELVTQVNNALSALSLLSGGKVQFINGGLSGETGIHVTPNFTSPQQFQTPQQQQNHLQHALLPSMDSGGMGKTGQSYYIGTGAQPELFTPRSAGLFTPAGGGGYNGPKVIQVNLIADGFVDHVMVNVADGIGGAG